MRGRLIREPPGDPDRETTRVTPVPPDHVGRHRDTHDHRNDGTHRQGFNDENIGGRPLDNFVTISTTCFIFAIFYFECLNFNLVVWLVIEDQLL